MVVALSVLGLAAIFAACAEASGELRGPNGEVLGASSAEDTSAEEFLGCDPTERVDAGTGVTWTELYRDLFADERTVDGGVEGASGGKCGQKACHGGPNTSASSKFECFDADNCYASIRSGWVRIPADVSRPERSGLVDIMRHCDENRKRVGRMPEQPRSYFFSQASMSRVKAWIVRGAPKD